MSRKGTPACSPQGPQGAGQETKPLGEAERAEARQGPCGHPEPGGGSEAISSSPDGSVTKASELPSFSLFRGAESQHTCRLYGVMTAMSPARTPASTRARTCRLTRRTSPAGREAGVSAGMLPADFVHERLFLKRSCVSYNKLSSRHA